MGVESKCIMPLPFHENDRREHIIRTEFANLESVEWWKSLQIDALVLYSWGAPRYRKIARAIHRAGIRLHIHMDTSGDFEGPSMQFLSPVKKILLRLKVKAQDILRARHLRYADIITAGKPAIRTISNRLFYGKWVTQKGFPMACPVSPNCVYDSRPKQDLILCIGRWDDIFQKRPEVLMATLEHFYAQGGTAETRIYGTITDALKQWHSSLPEHTSNHIKLNGYIQNSLLSEEYRAAKIVLCPSRYESSHIVSAEGLCSGCSIVVPPRLKNLCDVLWYTKEQSGTIAATDTPEDLAAALHDELAAWENGRRDPHAIAAAWQPFFHVDKVFNTIFK